MVSFGNVPAGFSVFATLSEVRSARQPLLASAVLTDSNGLPTGQNPQIAALTWEGVPMTQLKSGRAAWEIVSPEIRVGKPKLSFGFALVGPSSKPFTVYVGGWLAPWYDAEMKVRTSNSTLPIPRFQRLTPPIDVTFDPSQGTWLPACDASV